MFSTLSLAGRIIAAMPIRFVPAAAFLSAALLVNAGAGYARNTPSNPPAKTQSTQPQMSLERAVQQVQQQTNGRILAADSIPNGRNKLYRIKVLTPDGHVRVMQLHSNDGASDEKSSNRKGH